MIATFQTEHFKMEIFQIRGGLKHEKFGDPYEWTCMAKVINGVAEIKGLAGKRFSEEEQLMIINWCRQQGYQRVIYQRGDESVEEELYLR